MGIDLRLARHVWTALDVYGGRSQEGRGHMERHARTAGGGVAWGTGGRWVGHVDILPGEVVAGGGGYYVSSPLGGQCDPHSVPIGQNHSGDITCEDIVMVGPWGRVLLKA